MEVARERNGGKKAKGKERLKGLEFSSRGK